jgi:Mrp family chromosome partitioning ATPase
LLSRFVDGIVLIIKAGVTRKEILHRTLDQLRSVRANILGCVLNDVDLSRRSYGYYAQGYYYRRAQEYYGEDLEEKSAGS